MQTYPYSALSQPNSREEFSGAMAEACRQAGAAHYLVVRLHGADLSEVIEVVHDGGHAGDSRFGSSRHWTVERTLDVMRLAKAPKVFGGEGQPGIEVMGYGFGVAAIARNEAGACVVYLGLPAAVSSQEQLFNLASVAQLCAQHGCDGLQGRSARACPLSDRELASLRYYAAGKTPEEAGRALKISARTFENHLARARIRCGVDSSLAASILAFKEGWMDWTEVRGLEAAG